jgi:DNA-binding CsgD family transcriptional regulator
MALLLDPALQRLLSQLARCRTVDDVGALGIEGARKAFGSHLACTILLDESANVRGRTVYGLRDEDFEEWDRDWRPLDTVFPAAIARAMPVHNREQYSDESWRGLPIVTEYGARLRIDKYMAVPLFGSRGTLAGMLTICRRPDDRPFDDRSMTQGSAFAGFLSATLARVMESPTNEACETRGMLSQREWQIARLAAGGQNNLEIALQLGIARETVKQTLRRVYSKLDVRGRAPMAVKLAALERL